MGKGKRARERMQRFQAERTVKQKERKAALRAARESQDPAIEGGDGEADAAPVDTAEERQDTDATDSDVEMMSEDAPEAKGSAADAPAKGIMKYAGPTTQTTMHLDKKTDHYCTEYFLRLLDYAVSRQFLSSYGNQMKAKVWPVKYIRELNKSLLFTGKKYNDAARLQAFLTMVITIALQVKTDNPQWFPKTTEQVILLDDLVAYLRALHNEIRCTHINAGGLTCPRRLQAFFIYETIEYIIIDRQGFLKDNCAIVDMQVPGSLKDPTKKQRALFAAIEDWKASFPGDRFLLSELLETSIDPSTLLAVTMRPREGAGDGEADQYEDDEDWQGKEYEMEKDEEYEDIE